MEAGKGKLAGSTTTGEPLSADGIDRTAKLYVGGKQARPDGGYSYAVRNSKGKVIGQAGLGNRKDIRNAVEAAVKASAWSSASAHNRAQVLYFIAENLAARGDEFARRLSQGGHSAREAKREVDAALERIFFYAAHADKYDGRIHSTNAKRQTTLAFQRTLWRYGACVSVGRTAAGHDLCCSCRCWPWANRAVLVPSEEMPLIATRLLSGAGYLRRSWRCREHRHGRP